MMNSVRLLTAVDLSELPPPDAVEPLDFEQILQQITDDYRARNPEFDAVLESEPVVKLLEAFSYRELLLRQRVNDAARSNLLATARGADLDNMAAFFGVKRAAEETDDRLRGRTALAVEAFGAAGPAGAYRFFALTAAPEVKDVTAITPAPGQVLVTLLGDEGPGRVDQATQQRVLVALNADDVRPLTDVVSVRSAEIIEYQIDAGLIIYPGPEAEAIRQRALAAVTEYARQRHKLGRDITTSGLHAALHVQGVQRVVLRQPQPLPIVVDPRQAAFCTNIKVTVDGRGE
jgi:phage-related baseplate assembly protein